MGKRSLVKFVLAAPLAILVLVGVLSTWQVEAHQMSGAIFTTLPDGSVVNENVGYSDKCQVSLNGGPRGSQNDHLPDGDYVIAVTNPNGQTVLGRPSRVVTIGNGEGTFGPTSLCDLVEPSPYDTTPSPGGVYKAWLCKEGRLFVRHDCKTDNFKVREVEGPPPPVVPPGQPPTSPPIPPGIGGPPAQGPGPGQPPGAPPSTLPPVLKLPAAGISGYEEEDKPGASAYLLVLGILSLMAVPMARSRFG